MNSLDRCHVARRRLAAAAEVLRPALDRCAEALAAGEPLLTAEMATGLADAMEQQAGLLEEQAGLLEGASRSLADWVEAQGPDGPTQPTPEAP